MKTGENIRIVRLQKGLTQKQVAEACGMADSAIRKYESGQITPKYETLQRIATALGCDPYSLYSWDQATEALENSINARERVDAALDKLNDAGMEKAADAVEVIAEVPRYQAGKRPQGGGGADPAPPEGADTTSPENPPETPLEGE